MIGIFISIWTRLTGSSSPPPVTNHILDEAGNAILGEDGSFLTQE